MDGTTNVVAALLADAVEQAALAAAAWVGKGDSHAADGAATEAMRRVFSNAPFRIRIVIGEGERDEAPMLARGELYGSSSASGLSFDCAVDPLDGTSLVAKGLGGAISIAVLAETGGLVGAPDLYMEKLAVPSRAAGRVSLSQTPEERVLALSAALEKSPAQLRIAVQNRPRHETLIAQLRQAGARVDVFGEGDITRCLESALPEGRTDALMGIGAAPEGVISAAAIRCLGGHFQGRFIYDPDLVKSGLIGTCAQSNRKRLIDAGIVNPDHIFDASELASGTTIYVAMSGITAGDYMGGVAVTGTGGRETTTFLFQSGMPGPRELRRFHAF